jgi:hypothetical protein
MRINEFSQQPENRFDYDVVDDVCAFMRNDPIFYRKSFFPAISRIADLHREGKSIDKKQCLGQMIENALEAYCKRFDVADIPDQMFNDNDRNSIMDKIFSEEMEQIQKGEYK